jgi:hypothetical protein
MHFIDSFFEKFICQFNNKAIQREIIHNFEYHQYRIKENTGERGDERGSKIRWECDWKRKKRYVVYLVWEKFVDYYPFWELWLHLKSSLREEKLIEALFESEVWSENRVWLFHSKSLITERFVLSVIDSKKTKREEREEKETLTTEKRTHIFGIKWWNEMSKFIDMRRRGYEHFNN